MLNRILTGLERLYLLRVPALTALVMMWMGFALVFALGGENVLRGVFDVADAGGGFLATTRDFALTTMAAMVAGIAIGVTGYNILSNAKERFATEPLRFTRGAVLLLHVLPALPVFLVLAVAVTASEAPWKGRLTGLVAGAAMTYVLSQWPGKLLWKKLAGTAWIQHAAFVPGNRAGFVDDQGFLQGRHAFALYHVTLTLIAFFVYFALHAFRTTRDSGFAPTLAVVLVLLALLCWVFAALTFWLDHYRVPVLLLVVAWSLAVSPFRQGDHFYQGLPRNGPLAGNVKGSDIIGKNGDRPMILVAASGGGIQAAAWTVQVLQGLSEELSREKIDFSSRIKLISAVSGGAVGAMYFLDAYRDGTVPAAGPAQQLREHARASSLEPVAWGLAYPDLVFGVAPMLKGIGFSSGGWRPHATDGGAIFYDRGRLLEDSWHSRLSEGQRDRTLKDWRDDVAAGKRPAVVFNSTLTETGERFVLATTEFDTGSDDANSGTRTSFGRRDFFGAYGDSDLKIRTAVRLSATFPYVSPASRFLRNDWPSGGNRNGSIYASEPHVVDGGYYDNYGMISLLDWFDLGMKALRAKKQDYQTPPVLILEIRSSSSAGPAPSNGGHGLLFQFVQPLLTLYNVRGAGQVFHNAIDRDLVRRLYGRNVRYVVFEFRDTDMNGCPRKEPTSWHLTHEDQESLDRAWRAEADSGKNIDAVREFLRPQ